MNILSRIFGPPSERHKPGARSVELGAFGSDRMTVDELIAEGERLKRPCVLLKTRGAGEPIAWWHHKPGDLTSNRNPWITFDSEAVPGLEIPNRTRYLTLINSVDDFDGLLQPVDVPLEGLPLFGQPVEVIAPIEAVFAFGNDRVGAWLASNAWLRTERYNSNFPESALVESYQRHWFETYPIYSHDPDVYAALGGWHFPHAEDDWYELAAERLLILTVQDAEPWVEGWQRRDGKLGVIQRIT